MIVSRKNISTKKNLNTDSDFIYQKFEELRAIVMDSERRHNDKLNKTNDKLNKTNDKLNKTNDKFNLDEYYRNKNLVNKNEIYKVQIRITPPIHLINSTPYDFIINNNEKIISQQSIYSYHKNANLFLEYRQNINETDKKFKNNKMEIIMRIIKDIKLQIMYDNDIILADTYITEKEQIKNQVIN